MTYMNNMNSIVTPTGIRIKKCRHGYGLFASRDFKRGSRLAYIKKSLVTFNPRTAASCSLKFSKFENAFWSHGITEPHSWDCFLDHSDKPNAILKVRTFGELKSPVPLYAQTDIKKGEEITIDYRCYGDRVYKAKRYTRPSASGTRRPDF